MKQAVKRILFCAALLSALGMFMAPLLSCDDDITDWGGYADADDDGGDTDADSDSGGGEENGGGSGGSGGSGSGGNDGGGSGNSEDDSDTDAGSGGSGGNVYITSLTFAGNEAAGDNEVKTATFTIYDGSEKDGPGAGIIGHFTLGDGSEFDTEKHQRPAQKAANGNLTFKTKSDEKYTARWKRDSTQDTSAVITKIVYGDKIEDEDGEENEEDAVAITSFTFGQNVDATGTQVQAAMFIVEDDTVVAHFSLGDGNEVDTDETDVPEKTAKSGTLVFEAENGETYEAKWKRDDIQTEKAEVTKITGGEADENSDDGSDDENGGYATITAIEPYTNDDDKIGSKEVRSATFDVYDGKEEDGPGAGVIGHFTLGDGSEVDTEKADRPRRDKTEWTLEFTADGIVYEAKAKRESQRTTTATVTEIKALGREITSFEPYEVYNKLVIGKEVKSATFIVGYLTEGGAQVRAKFYYGDGASDEFTKGVPLPGADEISGTFTFTTPDGATYDIAWSRADKWTTTAKVNLITLKSVAVKTFVFAGNPDATGTEVKSATFNFSGESVNNYILNTNFTLGDGTVVHSSIQGAALSGIAEASGTFEFVAGDATYKVTWERPDTKAPEAKITSITGGKAALSIIKFKNYTNQNATDSEVFRATFSIEDGKVSAVFTLRGGTTITPDNSVDLPARTETNGTFEFTTKETIYTVTWGRSNVWVVEAQINKIKITQKINGVLLESFAPYTNENATGTGIHSATLAISNKQITAMATLGNGKTIGTADREPLPKEHETGGTFTLLFQNGIEYTITWHRTDQWDTEAIVDNITGGDPGSVGGESDSGNGSGTENNGTGGSADGSESGSGNSTQGGADGNSAGGGNTEDNTTQSGAVTYNGRRYETLQAALKAAAESATEEVLITIDGTITEGATIDAPFSNLTIQGSYDPGTKSGAGIFDGGWREDGSGTSGKQFLRLTTAGSCVTLKNLKITGSSGGNGAITVEKSATLTVTNCEITGNTGNLAGGIYSSNNNTITITGSIISNNTGITTNAPGGIYNSGGTTYIEDTVFENNSSSSKMSGVRAASVVFSSSLYIKDVKFTGNKIPSPAAVCVCYALYDGGKNTFENNTISGKNTESADIYIITNGIYTLKAGVQAEDWKYSENYSESTDSAGYYNYNNDEGKWQHVRWNDGRNKWQELRN